MELKINKQKRRQWEKIIQESRCFCFFFNKITDQVTS